MHFWRMMNAGEKDAKTEKNVETKMTKMFPINIKNYKLICI